MGRNRVAPKRVRGLKHIKKLKKLTLTSRTQTGAWIETTDISRHTVRRRVAPKGVHGLKLFGKNDTIILPSRTRTVRGLKPLLPLASSEHFNVAPNGCED